MKRSVEELTVRQKRKGEYQTIIESTAATMFSADLNLASVKRVCGITEQMVTKGWEAQDGYEWVVGS
jgi:hypothetical protein